MIIDYLQPTTTIYDSNNILANPKNWIVSEIIKENYDVVRVELKPLDISSYCKSVFEML